MCQLSSRFALMLIVALTLCGCSEAVDSSPSKSTSQKNATLSPVVEIDGDGKFAEILTAVDKVAGKSFQTMQMGAMKTATYQYDGTIDEVVSAIDTVVAEAGYKPLEDGVGQEGFAEGQNHMEAMMNMEMKLIGSKMYKHENGNVLTVMRMDISTKSEEMQMDMKMLTVQMMNPKKMSEAAATTDDE